MRGRCAHYARPRPHRCLYNIHDRAPDLAARYDAIILFDVIEHIESPAEFLASALYHLKPGGRVFINVPALQSLYSKFDVAVGHYRRYSKRRWRRSWPRPAFARSTIAIGV